MARIVDAIKLRDQALKLVTRHGKSKLVGDPSRYSIRVQEYDKAGLTIWHMPLGALTYSERAVATIPFREGRSGLDIWTEDGKVLNIEWSEDGEVRLISFKRGSWEKQLGLLTKRNLD